MVAVPQAVDQFGNADLLQALGVARHLPMEEATAETLREAVLYLAGAPEVARRLKEVQEGMAGEGGTRRAADLIEAELASGKERAGKSERGIARRASDSDTSGTVPLMP